MDTQLRVVLVDDSRENMATLEHLLSADSAVEVVGKASDREGALELLSRDDFDLAFLDIQLRETTIFDILEELMQKQERSFESIFVTAHGSFENATRAIRFACLDFITKPVDRAALDQALERAREKMEDLRAASEPADASGQMAFLLELLKGEGTPDSIGIVLPKGVIEFVKLREIAFLKADESVCEISFGDRSIRSTKSFGYYLDLLSGHSAFVQIAKGCLVNASRLKRYDHRERILTLDNGETLTASHRFARTLRKQLASIGPAEGGLLGRLRNMLGGS